MLWITAGPFWFSAEKFEVRTLNSWIMSVFGLTGVAQLHPGSDTCAPSAVMSREEVGRPFTLYAPFKALWLPLSPFPLMPMFSPEKFDRFSVPVPATAKPGMILINSAALRPTTEKSCNCFVVRVADFSPESTGNQAHRLPLRPKPSRVVGAHLHRDIEVPALCGLQIQIRDLVNKESCRFNAHLVCSRRDRGKREEPVRHCLRSGEDRPYPSFLRLIFACGTAAPGRISHRSPVRVPRNRLGITRVQAKQRNKAPKPSPKAHESKALISDCWDKLFQRCLPQVFHRTRNPTVVSTSSYSERNTSTHG